ncbi:hypothetical protein CEXT_358391 [Caerostris extrusa]|uniref:Uncharacterized protein n=1 Tax=Caerostris extrusa TaxID=172846 RepID=A0AAV4QN45_CAEEX|nr:hypothetical protein CEXT_358391 [Caerostris extrusa]
MSGYFITSEIDVGVLQSQYTIWWRSGKIKMNIMNRNVVLYDCRRSMRYARYRRIDSLSGRSRLVNWQMADPAYVTHCYSRSTFAI